MQAGDKSEQIKGLYVTQITEDGDLAVLSGSNQFSVSDKVIPVSYTHLLLVRHLFYSMSQIPFMVEDGGQRFIRIPGEKAVSYTHLHSFPHTCRMR